METQGRPQHGGGPFPGAGGIGQPPQAQHGSHGASDQDNVRGVVVNAGEDTGIVQPVMRTNHGVGVALHGGHEESLTLTPAQEYQASAPHGAAGVDALQHLHVNSPLPPDDDGAANAARVMGAGQAVLPQGGPPLLPQQQAQEQEQEQPQQQPQPEYAVIDDELCERIAGVAYPLGVPAGEGDYSRILAAIGDAQAVLLGESTHGTREFYQVGESGRLLYCLVPLQTVSFSCALPCVRVKTPLLLPRSSFGYLSRVFCFTRCAS